MSNADRDPAVAELIAAGRDREAARQGAGETVADPEDSECAPQPAGERQGGDPQ